MHPPRPVPVPALPSTVQPHAAPSLAGAMDTSTYLMELLGSFDGDISALSEQSSNSSGGSPDRTGSSSGGDMSVGDSSSAADASLFLSPPTRHSRRAPIASPILASPSLSPPAPSAPAASASSAASSSSTAAAAAAGAAAPSASAHSSRTLQVPDARRSSSHSSDEDLRMRHSQLKKNYRRQGEELEKTTRQYDELLRSSTRDRQELEDRVRSLEHKSALLESQYQKSQLDYTHALQTKQSELNGTAAALRSAQAQLADQNPDVLKQIEYVKDDLSDLATSEAMYLEYKAIDPHRQTIREYVCCAVYELVRAEKQLKEAMAKELELMRVKFIQAEDEGERNARERDQVARLKKNRETELLADVAHLETLNAKLHEELSRKTVQINELSSKGELYDSLLHRSTRLEEENSELRQKDLIASLTLKSLTEERETNASRLFQLEKSQDLLRQDKMYLTKETERLQECYRNSEKDKERAEAKNIELKRQKEELVDKLVKVREEHQQSYEEKLNAELNRLQSRTASDLESIRLNQREAFEREIKGLKESRDALATEVERLRTVGETAREDLHALQEEHRRLTSQLETERTDTRNALKLKQFEYERLSLTYEECMSDFRKLKIEHEVLLKKNTVLKNELYALQGASQKSTLELEAEVRNLKEKLDMYQQLEYELDMAILGAGGLEPSKGERGGGESGGSGAIHGNVRGIHSLLESLGSNIPTANKRRMKQSILLAQQLVEKQKRIQVLEAEAQHYKDRNNELDVELDAARRALDCTSQPHHYLIQSLRQKESELASVNKTLLAAQRQLQERGAELQRCITQRTALEADLHRLLQGKQHLDGIKEALLKSQTHYQTGVALLDQQYAAQQGMQQRGAAPALAAFKENHPPRAPFAGAAPEDRAFASLNDPRNHFPHQHQQGWPQSAPSQPQPAALPYAASQLSASQGRPTSAIPAHNQPSLASSARYVQPQPLQPGLPQSGDPSVDAQPKPLWFRKLAR